ncbi:hypothetical protein FRC09_017115 [Ceratobasidium sp. 395]|nr:hypothetical protein FRC09_017115 [Ceratobasidium sp. 395]
MSSEPGDLDFSLASLFDVRDKIALVTDGGSRTGAAIAAALLQNGAKVYVVCESEDISLSVKELLSDKGQCECIVSDLKSKAGCVSLCDTFKQLEDHLNILVNNSGATWGGNWEEFPDEGWDQAMATHVKSLLYGKHLILDTHILQSEIDYA